MTLDFHAPAAQEIAIFIGMIWKIKMVNVLLSPFLKGETRRGEGFFYLEILHPKGYLLLSQRRINYLLFIF